MISTSNIIYLCIALSLSLSLSPSLSLTPSLSHINMSPAIYPHLHRSIPSLSRATLSSSLSSFPIYLALSLDHSIMASSSSSVNSAGGGAAAVATVRTEEPRSRSLLPRNGWPSEDVRKVVPRNGWPAKMSGRCPADVPPVDLRVPLQKRCSMRMRAT